MNQKATLGVGIAMIITILATTNLATPVLLHQAADALFEI
jgi:hypothetical protein